MELDNKRQKFRKLYAEPEPELEYEEEEEEGETGKIESIGSIGKKVKTFRSLVPYVQTANDIAKYVGCALSYQHTYERKTSPWETEQWNTEEHELLDFFDIRIEAIDRVYRILCDINNNWCYLLARMEYRKGDFVFVELEAGCNYYKEIPRWGGNIYITRHAFIFTKTVYFPSDVERLIYQSLRDDGYAFEEKTEHDWKPAELWNEPPTLKFICLKEIYYGINHQEDEELQLKHYSQVLPTLLKQSVDEFTIIQEAIVSYDNWDFYTRPNSLPVSSTTYEDIFRYLKDGDSSDGDSSDGDDELPCQVCKDTFCDGFFCNIPLKLKHH